MDPTLVIVVIAGYLAYKWYNARGNSVQENSEQLTEDQMYKYSPVATVTGLPTKKAVRKTDMSTSGRTAQSDHVIVSGVDKKVGSSRVDMASPEDASKTIDTTSPTGETGMQIQRLVNPLMGNLDLTIT